MDFDQDTDTGRRNRTVVFSVLGLVTIGVLLGLLVGGLGLAAVRTVDLGDDDPTSRSTSGSTEPTKQRTEPTPTEDRTNRKPSPGAAVLQASPTAVSSYEQIDLSGRFPDLGAGVTLQVQRKTGGRWADFPVTATTREDGSFATYVQTGQSGLNKFRMMVIPTGETTSTASVQVG
jgi:hypothetical protein